MITIRRARTSDAVQIHALINRYASRSRCCREHCSASMRTFVIFTSPSTGSPRGMLGSPLHLGDMAEVRSLAVDGGAGKRGIGRALVEANISEAREHGLVQVYAFTYVSEFFGKLGFRVVPHGRCRGRSGWTASIATSSTVVTRLRWSWTLWRCPPGAV